METLLPLQPENNKRLLARSIVLYRLSFKNVLFLSILLSITIFIPRLLSFVINQDIFLNVSILNPHRLWLALINLAGLIFFIAMVWRMFCFIRNKHEPFIEDFTRGIKKVFYVFIATVLQSAFLFAVVGIIFGMEILLQEYHFLFAKDLIGSILTILTFMGQLLLIAYIATLFIFLVPLIAIENKGIISSLQYSVMLTWNHWWRVFSLQITPWIIFFLILLLIRFVFRIELHIYFFDHTPHSFFSTLINLILFTIFIPWVPALLLVQMADLELRAKLPKGIFSSST